MIVGSAQKAARSGRICAQPVVTSFACSDGRLEAVGVSRADVQFRSGRHHRAPALPAVPGVEGAGTVLAVGTGVADVAVGDHVVGWARPENPGSTPSAQLSLSFPLAGAPEAHRRLSSRAVMGKVILTG